MNLAEEFQMFVNINMKSITVFYFTPKVLYELGQKVLNGC